VVANALSTSPKEYRSRLDEQTDDQIDSWAVELMRDLSIRVGVRRVLRDFMAAAKVDERELERVYAGGGGPPATFGRTAAGEAMVPAIALHCLVPGLRRSVPDARARLTTYLVDNFHELVYI
jgi:hypothetical protein